MENKNASEIKRLTLSVSEMARALCIGTNSAYDLVHKAGFPKIQVGNRIIIPIKALEQWLVNNSLQS